MKLKTNPEGLDLSQPAVMGILNVTPDSFSDGGQYITPEAGVRHALQMIEEGADIIDIGGESTRPGAKAVSVQQELDRVIPVIEVLRRQSAIAISVDTSKAEVMQAAVAAGANIINDVRALQEKAALETAARLNVPVCLMHMKGQPRTMQHAPVYQDVVHEVMDFLSGRIAACEQAGIARENIIIDPGFGFGKQLEHNLLLFRHLEAFSCFDLPLLVGVSRKSMISAVLDVPVEARMPASIAMAGLAIWLGASIIRAHDVQATVDAVKMVTAIKNSK